MGPIFTTSTPGAPLEHQQPLLCVDMGASVADVAWSPTLPTGFAAVSEAGQVGCGICSTHTSLGRGTRTTHRGAQVGVYDLAQSTSRAVCLHKAVPRGAKPTRLAFAPSLPLLVVATDQYVGCTGLGTQVTSVLLHRGAVRMLKLPAMPRSGVQEAAGEACAALDRVLDTARMLQRGAPGADG